MSVKISPRRRLPLLAVAVVVTIAAVVATFIGVTSDSGGNNTKPPALFTPTMAPKAMPGTPKPAANPRRDFASVDQLERAGYERTVSNLTGEVVWPLDMFRKGDTAISFSTLQMWEYDAYVKPGNELVVFVNHDHGKPLPGIAPLAYQPVGGGAGMICQLLANEMRGINSFQGFNAGPLVSAKNWAFLKSSVVRALPKHNGDYCLYLPRQAAKFHQGSLL